MPGQPELEARIDSQSRNDGMCAIAMLDNIDGSMRATKLIRYFRGRPEMDRAFGFGFRWEAGRK